MSIAGIIIVSAIIGCAITYGYSPNAAFARVFIDIGALFSLTWLASRSPKQETINTDDIVDGLRDLAKNRFDKRLQVREQDELFQVRQAFNELAGTLSDSRDPSLTHIRYNPMNRVELKVTPLPMVNHSHHPELGQVHTAPELKSISTPGPAVITYPDPRSVFPSVYPKEPSTTQLEMNSEMAFETGPQPVQAEAALEPSCEKVFAAHQAEESLAPEQALVPEPMPEAIPAPAAMQEMHQEPEPVQAPAPAREERPESYPSDIGAADLFFLFERFKAAHDRPEETGLDFDSFLSSVKKAREDLIRTHHCRDVKFEVVSNAGAVALRPRLIR